MFVGRRCVGSMSVGSSLNSKTYPFCSHFIAQFLVSVSLETTPVFFSKQSRNTSLGLHVHVNILPFIRSLIKLRLNLIIIIITIVYAIMFKAELGGFICGNCTSLRVYTAEATQRPSYCSTVWHSSSSSLLSGWQLIGPAKVQWPAACCAKAELDQRPAKRWTKRTRNVRGVPTSPCGLTSAYILLKLFKPSAVACCGPHLLGVRSVMPYYNKMMMMMTMCLLSPI